MAIHARDASWPIRKHRLDDIPFIVSEFVPHDSMLQFGSLNHDRSDANNDEPACPSLRATRTSGGHREIDVSDPRRTLAIHCHGLAHKLTTELVFYFGSFAATSGFCV